MKQQRDEKGPCSAENSSLAAETGCQGNSHVWLAGAELPSALCCRDAAPSISSIYFSSHLDEQKAIPEAGRIICSTKTQEICSTSAED